MRFLAALWLFFLAAPAPEFRYFQFERPVQKSAAMGGQTCLVVDSNVFAHASPQLADIRLFEGTRETPYVVRSDVTTVSADGTASLLNLGKSANQTVFDAEMPSGQYSDLRLTITGHDFLATVTVFGSQSRRAISQTKLGSFTIFDLARQRLGRSTVLHLPESDFRYLHFQISGPIVPEDVTGLSVAHPPASQPRFVTVAETSISVVKDRNSIIEFVVPSHTPVDRVVIVPGQSPTNFSRDVQISVAPISRPRASDNAESSPKATTFSNILRIHSVQDGHRIDEEHLEIGAPQVDADGPTTWKVTIENRDDAPIQLASVRLEMLQRRLCFDATAGATYTLHYGDSALMAPEYDYASLFALEHDGATAHLGPESPNPAYTPRPDARPFTERHPILLWVALVLAIGLLGVVAFRSFKTSPNNPT